MDVGNVMGAVVGIAAIVGFVVWRVSVARNKAASTGASGSGGKGGPVNKK